MLLFRDIVDKQLVDCHGHKAGKVVDVLLEPRSHDVPVVQFIVTGPGASVAILPSWLGRAATWLEAHILGTPTIEPKHIAWHHVSHIDVVVHLDVDRESADLLSTEHTLWQRWLRHIPWAER
ncbi:MAG TPA: hypothetical protein VF898_11650 [Chloroflexota bacterium]